ncbi:MFS transporter [Corynebacterium diphtheriae]|uniref:MFS transporter n=1 Tax=Corynebacterium diphtheriae TaxID=1717 RepID=UPI0031407653
MANQQLNARKFIWSNGLQNIGDQIVAAKTVLPWLLHAAGASGFFIALLIPVREAGSMLPQAALTPWVVGKPQRKTIWVMGAVGQAAAGLAIAAALLQGTSLAVAVIVLLAGLSLARSLTSIASKDVQGRVVPKGSRGLVTGKATALGGAASLIVGASLWLLREHITQTVIVGLIVLAALAWLVAALVFHTITEPEEQTHTQSTNWWSDTWQLFVGDKDFRLFVIVRAFLLVSALSTSFIVVLSNQEGASLGGLGVFMLASGLSALVGGRISGVWSDYSSRAVMSYGALASSIVVLVIVACSWWAPSALNVWLFPLSFFVVNVVHTGIRVARKTYIVDMAEGDQRTRYVGAANTLMGVILLIVGVISGAIAHWGPQPALLFLAAIGLAGAATSHKLKDVE